MKAELEAFAKEGERRFRESPAGKWRWNCDGGTLIFYDMCLILRRDGTGQWEGYTMKPDCSGKFNIWKGIFRWEPVEAFCIRVQMEGRLDWCALKYRIGARRSPYGRLVWVIEWDVVSGDGENQLEGFSEKLDAGWGDLEDDEY